MTNLGWPMAPSSLHEPCVRCLKKTLECTCCSSYPTVLALEEMNKRHEDSHGRGNKCTACSSPTWSNSGLSGNIISSACVACLSFIAWVGCVSLSIPRYNSLSHRQILCKYSVHQSWWTCGQNTLRIAVAVPSPSCRRNDPTDPRAWIIVEKSSRHPTLVN